MKKYQELEQKIKELQAEVDRQRLILSYQQQYGN